MKSIAQASATFARNFAAIAVSAGVAGCAGGGVTLPTLERTLGSGMSVVPLTTADRISGGPCSVSVDGAIWYALPAGAQPPIDFTRANCAAAATLGSDVTPPLPAWSAPTKPTQAIFVATSLQEAYSMQGMQSIERLAANAGVPVTWMIGNGEYLSKDASLYNAYHAANGDDVELEPQSGLYDSARAQLPWFAPTVSVAGAGMHRDVGAARTFGDAGFWGITWNSHGTDSTSDEGAPWGTYCADSTTTYKRPSPVGDCSLVSFEWTARDLTRAYLANTNSKGYSAEAAFSTDPDDIAQRGGFSTESGAAYLRGMVDAYAAGGVDRPIVMMSQQESAEQANGGSQDDELLGAMYREAVATGMKPMTLREAIGAARQFSSQPRAIAFPFIPGGIETSYNGAPFTPATIDFHDNLAGMTFIAGHTLPSRLYAYAQNAAASTTTSPLVAIDPSSLSFPQLASVTAAGGVLSFSFVSPEATHFGIALWSDPTTLLISGTNVTTAGHAGAVVTFDLPVGTSTQTVRCGGCTSTTLSYST